MAAMVDPAFVRTMAAYNAEMNRRLYEAAWRIPDSRASAGPRRVLGLAARHALPSALGRPDVDGALRRLGEARA